MYFSRHFQRLFACFVTIAACVPSVSAYAAYGDVLDRQGLIKTFDDEFDAFSWHKVDARRAEGGGTWATYGGQTWCTPDDIRNRVQLGNKELGVYVDPAFRGSGNEPLNLNPFTIINGILNITASEQPNIPALYGYHYITGMITTQFTFSQKYGIFEMRAKLPAGRGLWPAFWLLPADKSWPPEIDILENLGHETTTIYTTLHSSVGGYHTRSEIPPHQVADTSKEFHTYAVDWGPDETIFYFDNMEIARRPTPTDMDKPFYMIANLAIGGGWPGSPTADTKFPAKYQIDWIRAYQRKNYLK